jgi:TonB family protein
VAAAIDSSQLSKECAVALTGLVQVTLADDDVSVAAGDQQWVVLPVAREFAACLALPWESLRSVAPRPDGHDIEEPRKTRNKRPTYPPAAQQARISGVVILEATIATDGCVKDLSIVRSVDPRLDLEALRSVAQWRYTSPRLGGEPVDVIMTVTVNFTLP